MLNPDINSAVHMRLKTLQIIAFGLILGVAIFAGIVAFMAASRQTTGGSPAAPLMAIDLDILRFIGGALLLSGFTGAFLVLFKSGAPNGTAIQQQRGDASSADLDLRFGRYFTSRVAAYAMLEAPALYGAVLVLLSGNLLDLVFVAPPLLGMLAIFPTAGKWENFAAHTRG